MSRYFLDHIKVEGFRGINNESEPLALNFKSDTVNSVFAVNGVGKSSIFEALCYAIRGSVPKLNDLQAQERPEQYIANRFHSRGIAEIHLKFKSDDPTPSEVAVHIIRNADGTRTVTSPTGHPDPEDFLVRLNEEFALIDYKNFMRFIDSSALERGRSFSALLGLSSYSDFRQALNTLADTRAINSDFEINTIKATIESANTAKQSAIRHLKNAYEGMTGRTFIDVSNIVTYSKEIESALSQIGLISAAVKGKTVDQIDFENIKQTVRSAEGGEKRKELEKTLEKITQLDTSGDEAVFLAEQTTIKDSLVEIDGLLQKTKGGNYQKLYDLADKIVKSPEWTDEKKCPLCEKSLEVEIKTLIEGQIQNYAKAEDAQRKVRDSVANSIWLRRLQALENNSFLAVSDETKLHALFKTKADSNTLALNDLSETIAHFSNLEKKRLDALAISNQTKEALEKEIPPSLVRLTEQIEFARRFCEALLSYNRWQTNYSTAQNKLASREKWRQFITKASDDFSAAESELSRKKIAEIDASYKSLFAEIMAIKDVVPDLQRISEREDLNVKLSQFHGQTDLSARALLSESYRNALAISVFLSAALKHSGSPRFIVLDDITSSFDAGHQWNLMEAIRTKLQYPTNPHGLQFIIFSHDGLLEKYFDRLGNAGDWRHQKLQGWPPMGSVMSQAQDANRLRITAERLLDAGQVKEAEPLIRQYLEFKLMQIIRKVGIPVPLDFVIKDHMKIVSNCLEAINANIGLNEKANCLILTATQLRDIKTVFVPALVGNWVSHYETSSGSSLSPVVLKGILQGIDNFAECFKYDDMSSGTVQRKWYGSLSK